MSLPTHCLLAVPVNPGLHTQWKPPGVLVHTELAPQRPLGPLEMSHSSISVIKEPKVRSWCAWWRQSEYLPIHPAAMSRGLKVQPSSQIQ